MFCNADPVRNVPQTLLSGQTYLFPLLILQALVFSLPLGNGCLVPAPEDAQRCIVKDQVPIPLHPMPLKHLTESRIVQASLQSLFIENGNLQLGKRFLPAGAPGVFVIAGARLSFSLKVYSIHARFTLCDTELSVGWQDHA